MMTFTKWKKERGKKALVNSRAFTVDKLPRAEVHVQRALTGTFTLCLLHTLTVQAQTIILPRHKHQCIQMSLNTVITEYK